MDSRIETQISQNIYKRKEGKDFMKRVKAKWDTEYPAGRRIT